MSKHFEDARYYLGRAAGHAKAGFREELEGVESRLRELTGREKEPEPSRLESIKRDLKELEARAEGRVREEIESARERLDEYRSVEEQPAD